MLIHRIITYSCILIGIVLLYFVFKGKVSFLWLFVPLFCWLGLTSWGAFDLRLNYFTTVFTKAETNKKVIALTFDDGPTEFTPQILDLLKKNQAKATFFCIGSQIEKYPEILERIIKEGHQVANHTFSHTNKMGFLSKDEVIDEISKTDSILMKFGVKSNDFRPPFGVTNPNIAKAISVTNKQVIGWNIRSLDTVIEDENKILNRIVPNLKPGSIVLLHDKFQRSVNVLEQLLQVLKENNYETLTVSELKNINHEN